MVNNSDIVIKPWGRERKREKKGVEKAIDYAFNRVE